MGRSQISSMTRSRAFDRVRTRSAVSTTPCFTAMIGLTESSVPMAAWAPLIRPPFLRYSSVSRATYMRMSGARASSTSAMSAADRPSAASSDRHPREDPLGHRGAERVHDVDLAVGQHVPGDLGALDRARQGPGDMDRDDRLGAGLERGLVGVLEVARRRGRGRRERRVRGDHPLPERGRRQLDAGLERLRAEVDEQRDDLDPLAGGLGRVHVRRGIGEDRDAAHVVPPAGSPLRCGHDTGRVQPGVAPAACGAATLPDDGTLAAGRAGRDLHCSASAPA